MSPVLHALFGRPSHVAELQALREMGDWALVQRVRDQDARAAEVFFDRFVHDIERVVCKTLPYPSAWDDAVSETFARALPKLAELGPEHKIRAWLLGVAANVAREHRRAARRPHWETAREDGPESVAPGSQPDAREAISAVHDLCARMAEGDAELVLLRWFSTLELTELAEMRGVSLATLKRHLSRAECTFFEMAANDARLAEWSARLQRAKEMP